MTLAKTQSKPSSEQTSFCLSSSPDKQKSHSLRSLRLCGEKILIRVCRRESAAKISSRPSRLGVENIVEVVLLNIRPVRIYKILRQDYRCYDNHRA